MQEPLYRVKNFLAPWLRPLPSPRPGWGFLGYLLFVLAPVGGLLTLWGHVDLVAGSLNWIEYALRQWWGYPALWLLGLFLLFYAGYRQQAAQPAQDAPQLQPSQSASANTDSSLWQEINRREAEHEQEKEQLRHERDTLKEKVTRDTGLTPEVAAGRRIVNCSFRIVDLLKLAGTDGSYIVGKEFENCTIYGPGVITLEGRPPSYSGSYLTVGPGPTCYVDGDRESVMHEVASGGAKASGVIHLVGCSFRRVTFSSIGITGTPEELEMWKCIFRGE